jgi:hypothetical protein
MTSVQSGGSNGLFHHHQHLKSNTLGLGRSRQIQKQHRRGASAAAATTTTTTATGVGNDYILVQFSSWPQWMTTLSSINHMIDGTNPEEKNATGNRQQQTNDRMRKDTQTHKRQWKDVGGGATVATPACFILLC